jgi:branched-chain amino acid transport system substrate-binding protein
VQARSAGLKQPMLGGDGWDSPKLFEVAKAQLQGSYFSNHYSAQSKDPRVVKFVADYKARYGIGNIPDALGAVAYDAALVMADAIKRAGALDRAKLRDALAQTKDFKGVTGTISMDANRDAIKPAVILKVVGNEGEYVTTIQP